MAKLKTSISLDERLLADLDRQAETDGISRSELIERICRRSLDEEPRKEFFRMYGMPSDIHSVISAMSWHNDDGPVELVIRMPLAHWDKWLQKRTAEPVDPAAGEGVA